MVCIHEYYLDDLRLKMVNIGRNENWITGLKLLRFFCYALMFLLLVALDVDPVLLCSIYAREFSVLDPYALRVERIRGALNPPQAY